MKQAVVPVVHPRAMLATQADFRDHVTVVTDPQSASHIQHTGKRGKWEAELTRGKENRRSLPGLACHSSVIGAKW